MVSVPQNGKRTTTVHQTARTSAATAGHTAPSGSRPSESPAADGLPWLKLSENTEGSRYFEDESGKPVNLFGMARCQCCAWCSEDSQYGGAAGVARHFQNLGCNVIRLAIDVTNPAAQMGAHDYILECGGYNEAGINRFIDRYVEPDLRAILDEGMYVVLDLHEYPPEGVDEVQYAREHYIPIWRELAKRYKDEPGIAVFELWNEPYPADVSLIQKGDEDWIAGVREFFIDAVNEVREIDKRHVIMVSDYNAGWGTAWDATWGYHQQRLDPVYRNTCYSIHLSNQQLDIEAPNYADWLIRTADANNVCLVYGEVETEPGISSVKGMVNLVDLLRKNETTHHPAAILWRPHNDEINYVSYWTDFVKGYTAR